MYINAAISHLLLIISMVINPHSFKSFSGIYQASLQVLDESTVQLWWAGKELQRGKKLQDYIGKNEKTKIICKLQKVRII